MIQLVASGALAGFNYVRVDQVIAISATDPSKCVVVMTGGVNVPCSRSRRRTSSPNWRRRLREEAGNRSWRWPRLKSNA